MRTGRREAAEKALKAPGDVQPCWTRPVPVYSEVEKRNIHIEIAEVADDSGFLSMAHCLHCPALSYVPEVLRVKVSTQYIPWTITVK